MVSVILFSVPYYKFQTFQNKILLDLVILLGLNKSDTVNPYLLCRMISDFIGPTYS